MASREYFSHDYHARTDPKMVRLIMEYGMEGVGIYWCIVEMLYESGGYIDLSECERIAFELRTDSERIAAIVHTNLFCIAGEKFYSETALNRLEKREEKSRKATTSAQSRWGSNSKDDANAMRTQCDSNAIKVNKSKVNKKEKKEETHARDSFLSLIDTPENPNHQLVKKWAQWAEFRKKMKKPYRTTEGESAAYNRLLRLAGNNSEVAIGIIDQSIENEWQGLFPLKDQQNNSKPVNGRPKTMLQKIYEQNHPEE